MKDALKIDMRLKDGRVTHVIRDVWLMEAGVRDGRKSWDWGDIGRTYQLSEAFDRWERAGIDLNRPFTVVVDTVGQTITVEQEAERG